MKPGFYISKYDFAINHRPLLLWVGKDNTAYIWIKRNKRWTIYMSGSRFQGYGNGGAGFSGQWFVWDIAVSRLIRQVIPPKYILKQAIKLKCLE